MTKKNEAYWVRWLEEHDTVAMIDEIIELNHSLADAKRSGMSTEGILIRGRRQAQLIHELLEWYNVDELAEESGFSRDTVIGLNTMHLAGVGRSVTAHPSQN